MSRACAATSVTTLLMRLGSPDSRKRVRISTSTVGTQSQSPPPPVAYCGEIPATVHRSHIINQNLRLMRWAAAEAPRRWLGRVMTRLAGEYLCDGAGGSSRLRADQPA